MNRLAMFVIVVALMMLPRTAVADDDEWERYRKMDRPLTTGY